MSSVPWCALRRQRLRPRSPSFVPRFVGRGRFVTEKLPRAVGAKIAFSVSPPSLLPSACGSLSLPPPSPVERKSGYFLEISPPQTQHNAHPVSLNQMYSADRHSTVAQCWDGMNPSFRPFAKQALRTTQVCARIDCTAEYYIPNHAQILYLDSQQ